jgi:hypothetical protein
MKSANYVKGFCFIWFCLSISCSNKEEHKLPLVNINGKGIAELDPKKLYDTTRIKLSQIADNIEVIKLQTTEESLLKSIFLQIGNENILAKSGNEIYQFSHTGKFIRLIAKKGRGPGEIPSMGKNIAFNFSEKLDILYISVGNEIYLYKLSSGDFIGRKGLNGFEDLKEVRSITLTNSDSLFIYSYFSRGVTGDSPCSGVIVQDWHDNIIWEKQFNYNTWSIFPPPINHELLHGSNISVVCTENPREFIFQVDNHDTSYVFSLNNWSLKPYLLRRTQGPLKDGYPIDLISLGSYTVYQEFNQMNGYQLMRMDLLTSFVDINNLDNYIYNILYNDNNKTAYNISIFDNDYFDFIHRYNGFNRSRIYPSLASPHGKLLIAYPANEFLKLASEELSQPALAEDIKERLQTLSNSLTETDNPLLVIGDLKRDIKID